MQPRPAESSETTPVLVLGPLRPVYEEILTPAALAFVGEMVREFRPRVDGLLRDRERAQARYDAGGLPGFRTSSSHVRELAWKVAPVPEDLQDRRVEITGPVDRKMIINALNSGANVFMADFEDSCAPTWDSVMEGQINLYDAVRRTIRYEDPVRGKRYELGASLATLMVRPRGWHLVEAHLEVDGRPVPAAFVDFGLFLFHNARELVARGSGPYFYLPKLQTHLEARLWNDVFGWAQARVGIPWGTIKATVLLETLPAAFEMEEILYELRDHSAGLNCGRWDYIFSFTKTFREHADRVLPERSQVGMTQPFMSAYTRLLVKTCHRRGAHAMGGMAAQIPIKGDVQANEAAMDKVRADKLREVQGGHDGTWVAHPGLVGIAKAIFDVHMPTPNQIHELREDVQVNASDLLAQPEGTRSLSGLHHNVRVGVQYIEAWLRGVGCVPLYHLMEDAATAEISRAQIWQWLRHGALLIDENNGSEVVLTTALFDEVLEEELDLIRGEVGRERFDAGRYREAADLFSRLSKDEVFEEFLTLSAYPMLCRNTS